MRSEIRNEVSLEWLHSGTFDYPLVTGVRGGTVIPETVPLEQLIKGLFTVGEMRLLKLAMFLWTLDPKRFRYDHFIGKDWGGDPLLSCGTTACAIGWCPTVFPSEITVRRGLVVPEFRFLGYVPDESEGTVSGKHMAQFFGISYKDYKGLFNPWYNLLGPNATAKEVAEHLRKFVMENL